MSDSVLFQVEQTFHDLFRHFEGELVREREGQSVGQFSQVLRVVIEDQELPLACLRASRAVLVDALFPHLFRQKFCKRLRDGAHKLCPESHDVRVREQPRQNQPLILKSVVHDGRVFV